MTLNPYTASVFPTRLIAHGFFTRRGGISSGIYSSLNCGPGSDDNPENVIENRQRAVNCLAEGNAPLATLYQIHSNQVVVTNKAFEADSLPKADALVTNTRGLVLGVLTADCAPVLFADANAGVIAAAHAGWRGALAGIIEQTVKAMETLGATKTNIKAAIGPCISRDTYEVSQEFFDQFVSTDRGNTKYFSSGAPGKHYFDLEGFVMMRLFIAGVKAPGAASLDTYQREEDFFSYRRMCHRGEVDYGRQLSAIYLPPTS